MHIKIIFSFLIILASVLCDNAITNLKLLGKFQPSDFVKHLDLSKTNVIGTGGRVDRAFVDSFPALEGQGFNPINCYDLRILLKLIGISMALQSLEPCALSLPHVHPRATEMIYVNYF
jgi:hypothetical protein